MTFPSEGIDFPRLRDALRHRDTDAQALADLTQALLAHAAFLLDAGEERQREDRRLRNAIL